MKQRETKTVTDLQEQGDTMKNGISYKVTINNRKLDEFFLEEDIEEN